MTLVLRCHVHVDLAQVLEQAPVLLLELGLDDLVDLVVPVLQLLLEGSCRAGYRPANDLRDLRLQVAVAVPLVRAIFASYRA